MVTVSQTEHHVPVPTPQPAPGTRVAGWFSFLLPRFQSAYKTLDAAPKRQPRQYRLPICFPTKFIATYQLLCALKFTMSSLSKDGTVLPGDCMNLVREVRNGA
jgi:hypothetical protein